MKQAMSVMYFFLAAALMAVVLTGCSGPGSDPDAGINPSGDAGPDSDGNVDVPDAGPDSTVLPDSGTDTGVDGGPVVDPCADPEYVGIECNLPEGMVYSRDAFLCAGALDNDLWTSDAPGAMPQRERSHIEGDVLYVYLKFLEEANAGAIMPGDRTRPDFTCGPDGECWLNCRNPASNYACCKVSFLTDCSEAPVMCWPPGGGAPVPSRAYYAGT